MKKHISACGVYFDTLERKAFRPTLFLFMHIMIQHGHTNSLRNISKITCYRIFFPDKYMFMFDGNCNVYGQK